MREPLCLDAEVRQVPGYNLAVSAAGEVFGPRGRRKPSIDSEGYRYVSTRVPGKRWPQPVRVHVAVLLAWRGPAPAGHEGRHANGDQGDNSLSNLSWSTHLANIGDKYAHGTMPQGAGCHNAKLDEAGVRDIRRRWGSVPRSELAERYGITDRHVWKIATGRAWRHVR